MPAVITRIPTVTISTMHDFVAHPATGIPTQVNLRLWQLISPTLPIGAYAYSQGLEYAVDSGWVDKEVDVLQWIQGLMSNGLARLDIPLLARLYRAWQANELVQVRYWNDLLLASRESSEILAEDEHLGSALYTLLNSLDVEPEQYWNSDWPVSYAAMFSLAATHWQIALQDAAMGYLWAWCENQVAAAIKLVPLGQTAGQRILSYVATLIPNAVRQGLELDDNDIGIVSQGLAIASAKHETQYSRLFRS